MVPPTVRTGQRTLVTGLGISNPMVPQTVDSRIPVELEQIFFEIAALSHPIDIPNLMLIAWRVKEWCVLRAFSYLPEH
jgi:hypothetical protein